MTEREEDVEKLRRNARFYRNEANALAADEARRDRRRFGSREAATVAELLESAVTMLETGETP